MSQEDNYLYLFERSREVPVSYNVNLKPPRKRPETHGSYGEVYIEGNKVMKFADIFGYGSINEVSFLRRMNYPTIIEPISVTIGSRFIMTEMSRGKSLEQYILEKKPLPNQLRIAIQLLSGLAYLHGRDTVHYDIKSANALYYEKEKIAKLIDFGAGDDFLCYQGDEPYRVGTPAYFSIYDFAYQEKRDKKSDLWSLGIVLYEMVTGSFFISNPSSYGSMVREIVQKTDDPSLHWPEYDVVAPKIAFVSLWKIVKKGQTVDMFRGHQVDKQLRDIIMKLLQHNPLRRWPAHLLVRPQTLVQYDLPPIVSHQCFGAVMSRNLPIHVTREMKKPDILTVIERWLNRSYSIKKGNTFVSMSMKEATFFSGMQMFYRCKVPNVETLEGCLLLALLMKQYDLFDIVANANPYILATIPKIVAERLGCDLMYPTMYEIYLNRITQSNRRTKVATKVLMYASMFYPDLEDIYSNNNIFIKHAISLLDHNAENPLRNLMNEIIMAHRDDAPVQKYYYPIMRRCLKHVFGETTITRVTIAFAPRTIPE